MTQAPGLVIQIEKFDLTTNSAQVGREFSDRVSKIARGPLRKIMEAASAPYQHQFHSIDRLEIDLDEIAEDDFDEALKEKLYLALRDQFARLFGLGANRNTGSESRAGINVTLHTIALALQGSGTGQDWGQLQTQLEEMLASHGTETVRVLYRIGKKYRVRHNLAYRMDSSVIHAFLLTALPQHAQYITGYHEEIQQIHARKAIVAEPQTTFRAVIWELILNFLFLEDGSYFNSKSMIASTLGQLAARYRMDFAELLRQLSDCIDEQNLPRELMLPKILLELRETDDVPKAKPGNQLGASFSHLEAFLLRGVLSWNAGGNSSPRRVQALLLGILDQAPHQLLALLEKLSANAQVPKRLAQHLDWATHMQLLEVFTPQSAGPIGELLKEITAIQAKQAIVPAAPEAFADELWELVWSYQLSQRGSLFNKRSFLKSLLLGFAARHGLTYLSLLEGLVAKAFSGLQTQLRPGLAQDSWPNLLYSLLEERQPDKKVGSHETDIQTISALRAFLVRQRAITTDSYVSMRQHVQDILIRLAGRYHISYSKLLESFVHGDLRLEQMAYLNRPALLKIIESLFEEEAGQYPKRPAEARIKETWNAKYERAAREFLVQSLFLDRGSYHNNRSYVKNLLQKIAARHSLNYSSLLIGISALNREGRGPDALPAILRDLDSEQKKIPYDQSVWLEFFETGEFSGESWKLPSMQTIFKELTSDPETLRAWFRSNSRKRKKIEAFLRYFTQEQLQSLLTILQPGFSGFMQTYMLAMLEMTPAPENLKVELWRCLLTSSAHGHPRPVQQMLPEWNRFLAVRMGVSTGALWRALANTSRRLDADRFRVLDDMLESGEAQSDSGDPGLTAVLPEDDGGDEVGIPLTHCIHGELPLSNAERFLHFLQFSEFSGNQKESDAWQAIAGELQRDPMALLKNLMHALARQQESQCLIQRVPQAIREQMLDLLLGQERSLFAYFVDVWKALQRQLGFHDVDAESFILQFFVRSLLAPQKLRLEAVVSLMIRKLRKSYSALQVNKAFLLILDKTDASGNTQQKRFKIALEHAVAQLPISPKEPARKPANMSKENSAGAGESFYISNAGLVLLWQYLGMLFQRLGWVSNGEFTDSISRSRAVILLQFLADGEGVPEESELLLNKILCGMPEDMALEIVDPLSDTEKDYANQLLVAVTQHWDKLKNTDINGLRATFLMRKGRLRKGADNWQLLVDKGPFDPLLKSLPWSISMVKIGWMDKPVLVEWI